MTASDILHRLDADGPVRLTLLAAVVGVSQPSMTQLVQRLERRGIVCRQRDPNDGRASLVAITDLGRANIQEQRLFRRERLANLLTTLDPKDQAALELATRVVLPIVARLNRNSAV